MKNFVLGIVVGMVGISLVENTLGLIDSWFEVAKLTPTKKIMQGNKEINDIQLEIDGSYNDHNVIGFQVPSKEEYEEEYEEDRLQNKIGFR